MSSFAARERGVLRPERTEFGASCQLGATGNNLPRKHVLRLHDVIQGIILGVGRKIIKKILELFKRILGDGGVFLAARDDAVQQSLPQKVECGFAK